MKIAIKRASSKALTEKLATPSDAQELAAKLAIPFPPNPPNYDPSLFGGLPYKEITTRLATLQPLDIHKK